ncbi:MAG: hypothetical protein WC560_09940 [Syntrophales bacterium]
MKTQFINNKDLLTLWEVTISATLFPKVLIDELRPFDMLDDWGDNLPVMRQRLQLEVDAFIERVLTFNNTPELWSALRELDPSVMALYCDRLNAATYALQNLNVEMVEIPASWSTFIAQLLFQMLPQ